MTGYRNMISHRIPSTWDITLRWCKCRNKFIERVYDVHIRPLNSNVMRTKKQNEEEKEKKIVSYINPKKNMADAIDLTNLLQYGKQEYTFWSHVVSWNEWFCKNIPYIKNAADVAIFCGSDNENLCNEIAERYTRKNHKLAEFILKQIGLWIDEQIID